VPTAGVNGITMYYEVRGDGPPLVLILGLAGDMSEIGGFIDGLATRYRVLAFDNRGAGRTDKPDAPYSIEMMAEDTVGLMLATGFERANVLGISLGGRIAMELTLQHPEMVTKLVLASSAARVVNNARRRLMMGVLSRWVPSRGAHPQPRYAFERQLGASAGWNGVSRLPGIGVPTAIMHGQRDRTAPFERAQELHAGIPGSKLVVFEGGHLFLMMRERQRFQDEVATFLSSE
jgi:3-oxoadipate enol-lactonase